jgi:hypothetical protein
MNKRIGLVIHSGANLFSNGITQNAWFMYECLRECGYSCEFLSNEPDPKPFAFKGLMLRSFSNEFPYHEYLAIITITKSISNKDYDAFHRLCIPVISFVCGNHFMVDMESFIYCKDVNSSFQKDKKADIIWLIPSLSFISSYMETLNGLPTFEMPHLWSPQLIEYRALTMSKVQPEALYFKLKNYKKFDIIVLEPNINIIKNCVCALAIAEYIYIRNPSLINRVYISNLPNNAYAKQFIENLTVPIHIQKGYKEMDELLLTINSGEAMPIFICNQLYNTLNYVYYECLYYGYPFVHNSPSLEGNGYYYPEFSVEEGATSVMKAFRNHIKGFDAYSKSGREYLERVNPYSKDVQSKWTLALTSVLT